ncbi:MAG: hypothetical protein GY714_16505 [Desulfobacterales bacterium]|nr:hypothetical protein [Desulfobacterales bacterium]
MIVVSVGGKVTPEGCGPNRGCRRRVDPQWRKKEKVKESVCESMGDIREIDSDGRIGRRRDWESSNSNRNVKENRMEKWSGRSRPEESTRPELEQSTKDWEN